MQRSGGVAVFGEISVLSRRPLIPVVRLTVSMAQRGGFPNHQKRARARVLLAMGDAKAALSLLAGSCFGAAYDCEYFELLGRALLKCGYVVNAGRFLFLSGVRAAEYEEPISIFLGRHSDRRNFRQLQSQLPERVRVLWKLAQFPSIVAAELRLLGWPEDMQREIILRRASRRTMP